MMGRKKGSEAMKEKVAISVVGWLYRLQMKWAKWMESAVGRLSPVGIRFVFAVFVLIGCAVYGRILFNGFTGNNNGVLPEPAKARIIVLSEKVDSLPGSDLELEVRRLRNYLDSIQDSPNGERKLDSIMNAEGHLLDRVFERFYNK